MDYQDQCSYTGKVSGPRENYQGNGGVVVDEHFPEVLPLNIKELADGQ